MKPLEIIAAAGALSRGMTRPAYRGQANANWKLHSGALRRFIQANGDGVLSDLTLLRNFLDDYHKHVLLLPMETMEEQSSTNLQKLSTLQHLGAATGLLDFTESPLVALWFACQEDPDNKDADGRIFALDIGDHNVAVNGRLVDDPFDTSQLDADVVHYYEPSRGLGARIVAQQSVFIIGNPLIPEQITNTLDVPCGLKAEVLDRLKEMGLSKMKLFGDVPGLAMINAASVPLRKEMPKSPQHYKNLGNLAYQEQRFDDALAAYNHFKSSYPAASEPYCLLGDTLASLGRQEEAIKAYSKAIENIHNPIAVGANQTVNRNYVSKHMLHAIHYNRGNAFAATGDHSAALKDYNEAVKFDEAQGHRRDAQVLYNRANSKFELAQFDGAFEDYASVNALSESSRSFLAMGHSKLMAGSFDAALECFEQGVAAQSGDSQVLCQKNASNTLVILDAVRDREFDVTCRGRDLIIEVSGLDKEIGGLIFVGHPGNVGNTPSSIRNAPGGKGYAGVLSSTVYLVKKPVRQ